MKKKRHHIWKNILIMAAVFLVASGSSIILQKTGVHEHITAIFTASYRHLWEHWLSTMRILIPFMPWISDFRAT